MTEHGDPGAASLVQPDAEIVAQLDGRELRRPAEVHECGRRNQRARRRRRMMAVARITNASRTPHPAVTTCRALHILW